MCKRQHYLGRKSPAHISLHYTALATMFYAMLGVVTSEGGFSFLFFWELMTVASFLLILFDAERREVRRAALAYVIMMHVGFALLLIGFVRLDSVCGSADFALLGEYFRTQPALPLFVEMCIRDSLEAQRSGIVADHPVILVGIGFGPVSYTHLDVYKRQGLCLYLNTKAKTTATTRA